ncbi:MAG: 3-deoxy-D-manno-octulosonic acid transferase [Betaproteobacteria bacterium]|nr:MAG: 3-deoxy-D-manno-octulosonic acid transferase [Betaproteobacteria bacterium]
MIWRIAYTLALYAALPLILLKLWWRGRREPGYRRQVRERFGEYKSVPERPVIWLHAVSVGEARGAEPLVRALQTEFADHAVLVTCMTAAGRETVKQVYGESVLLAWLPYDFPRAVQRFLEHYRPRLGLLMETEIWPNLLAACRDYAVPVVLANARLSETSARGYARWPGLSQPAFAGLAAVCAQSESDAARLAAQGASRVVITGNLKFDLAPDAARAAEGIAWRRALGRPVLLLASTREGEERLLLEALRGAVGAVGETLVLVVPRHPQRFDEVARLLRAETQGLGRRSHGETPAAGERLYLGDTLGEMAFYFAAADVAVIGGSFAPLGGQNLIEGCAAGTPVVLGPSMYNFADATRLALESGAALQCANAAAAVRAALALCADPPRCQRMGEAGKRLCAAHRGATGRHLEVCRRVLRAPARD